MASESSKSKQATTVDVTSVLHIIWDHLWLILFMAALGGGAVFFYRMSTPPLYSSRAVLEVVNDRMLTDFQSSGPEAGDLNSASLLKTIEQTVASQAVLRRVIETNKLAEDPTFAPPRPGAPYTEGELIEMLRWRISVSLIRGTRLIAVVASDVDPQRAKRLAQSVIDAFFGQNLDVRREGSSSTREVLASEARRLEEELRKSEERLQDYLEQHNAVSLADRQSVVTERLRSLQQQVTSAKNTRLTLETSQELIDSITLDNPEKLLTIREISSQPEIVDLRRQLNARGAEVATLSQRYRDKHPSMIRVKQQYEETRAALYDMVRHAAESILQTYTSAQATERALERELAKQEKAALELERIAIPFRELDREVRSNAELYQQVLARLKATDVTQGIISVGGQTTSFIRVIEQPMVPLNPSQMSLMVVVAAGIAVGGVLGMGLAIAGHALDSSVQSVDEAEAMLGVPSLAVVPRSSHRNLNKGPVVATHPKTPEAEAFRSLRTALTLLRTDEERKSVLFTSAVPGEGKSYCSTNYATAIAQQGFRTLLIDADLRRPRLRRVFAKSSRQPGLSDCLHDPRLFPQTVHATTVPNLFIVGDPRGTHRGLELMGRENLQLVLQLAYGGFDRVVIDTAPLTAVSDALYFAQHVSTVCLVIHAGRTPRRTVRRACKLLAEVAKKTPAGVVLNQIRGGRASRYYYYSDSEYYIRGAAPVAVPG